MLCSSMSLAKGSFLTEGRLQQINCFKIRSIQSSETQQSLPANPPPLLSLDTRRQCLRLCQPYQHYQPYRKFVHRHKIIQKQRARPSNLVHLAPPKFIRRVISLPPKAPHSHRNREMLLMAAFDWMKEAAALMKTTKNAFYRAMLILHAATNAEGRLVCGRHINELACAALAMGCKFECSQRNYLEEVFLVNYRRISKLEINNAENLILKALNWNIPVHVYLEETLASALAQWGSFLRDCGGRLERNLYAKHFLEEGMAAKYYIEVVYLVDYLVIRRFQDWLRADGFLQPVLLSVYIISSVNVGDVHLDEFTLWDSFSKLASSEYGLQLEQLARLKAEVRRWHSQERILEVLGEIPPNLTFEKLVRRRNEQFFIPKVECIL